MKSFGRTLGIIWFGHLVVDLLVGIWPAYKTLAHLDLAAAGIILGISGFIGDGFQLFFGFLGDKGYRKLLLFFGLLLASSASLLAYSTSYPVLFVLVLLTYLGSGLFHPSAAGLVQSLAPERRGFAMGIFASGGALGLASTQLLFTYLYFSFSGQTLILLVFALAVFLLFRKIIYFQEKKPITQFSIKKVFEPFTIEKKSLTILYFGQLCQQATLYAFVFLMPDVLRHQGQSDWICFGGGHCLFTLGAVMMLIPAGLLADKFGQKKVLLGSIMISFFLYYAFLFHLVQTPVAQGVFLLAFGACMGIYNPIGVSLGNKMLPQYSSSVSALLMGFVWCFAHIMGPAFSGVLTRFFETDAPIQALFYMGMLLPLSCVLTLLLPALKPATQDIFAKD